MEIKNSFWIVDGKNKIVYDNEQEAVKMLKSKMKSNEKCALKMFTFTTAGDVEFKQVSWEDIAKQLIKGE